MRKARAFSDISVTESCMAVQKKRKALINKKVGEMLILNKRITQEQIDTILEITRKKYEDNVDTNNLVDVIEFLFIYINKNIKCNTYDTLTLILEITSSLIDESHMFNDKDYISLYKPLIQNIVPRLVHFMQINSELNTELIQKNKKKRLFSCFKKK